MVWVLYRRHSEGWGRGRWGSGRDVYQRTVSPNKTANTGLGGKWHFFCLCHLCVQKHLLLRLTANFSQKRRAFFSALALLCAHSPWLMPAWACMCHASPAAWTLLAFRLRYHSKDFTSQDALGGNRKVAVITTPKALKNCPSLTSRIG